MRRTAACPECGGRLVEVVYGLPGPALVDASARGEVVLRGCLVPGREERYECSACERRWYADHRGRPLVLVAEIGRPGDWITAYVADDDRLTVTVGDRRRSRGLSPAERSALWTAVDAAGAWGWHQQHVEHDPVDGTQWYLFAHRAGRRCEVEASGELPPRFPVLAAVLGELIGRPFAVAAS